MNIEKVQFAVGDELLVGDLVGDEGLRKPSLLFLHGAGKATRQRVQPLALELAKYGLASFAFDFSGHGESTGKLEESSLAKRTREAKEALKFLDPEAPLTICASSMGGHIALELLKTEPIKNLFLFCPAMYDQEAFAVPFNSGFSEIIRKKESWRNADVLHALQSFSGNFFLCIGDQDEVIPRGVIDLMAEAAKNARQREILIVPNVGHQLMSWMTVNENHMNQIVNKILVFLRDDRSLAYKDKSRFAADGECAPVYFAHPSRA